MLKGSWFTLLRGKMIRKTALFREKTVRLAGGALAAAMLIATVGVLGYTVGLVANEPVELSEVLGQTTALGSTTPIALIL